MIERIAIIGGSSVYTPELIVSLISHNVNVREIVLVGRPGPKLASVSKFCQRLIHKSGFPSVVIPSTDIREAVVGARYVLNHIRVGGMAARVRDEKLPPKQGMIGDESLGAGGFANAMRTLPVVLDIAARIEEVNPETVFINLTNPMGICVEALVKYSKLCVLGVCDLPGTYVKKIAELLRYDPATLDVDYIGLNHLGWIQDVKVDGRSHMSRVLERLEAQHEDGFDHELIGLFRMIPTRTVSLYYHQDEILKRQQSCSRFRAEVLHEAEQQILKLYQDDTLNEVPELTRARNAVWYEETIVPLILALESKKEQNMILCTKNEGAIRDLPEDCSVEIPVEVSKKGIRPRKVGSCPRFLRGLFLMVKESDRLTVEAVRHKSYEYALQALTINPLVSSLDAARRFLDRLIREEHLELH
ncbi:MAG: 6-phospho-beta-glucosidase [Candidatus Hydrogenedentota bacterium]